MFFNRTVSPVLLSCLLLPAQAQASGPVWTRHDVVDECNARENNEPSAVQLCIQRNMARIGRPKPQSDQQDQNRPASQQSDIWSQQDVKDLCYDRWKGQQTAIRDCIQRQMHRVGHTKSPGDMQELNTIRQ